MQAWFCPPSLAGVLRGSFSVRAQAPLGILSQAMAAAACSSLATWRWFRLDRPPDGPVVARRAARRHSRDPGGVVALAPLSWLMTVVYAGPVVGYRPLCRSPVFDSGGLRALHRDARDVHPDHRCVGRGGGQARPVHGQAQPSGQGDRGRHRAGHARHRRGAGSARVGRPAPRRRQDRRAGSTSCRSRNASTRTSG